MRRTVLVGLLLLGLLAVVGCSVPMARAEQTRARSDGTLVSGRYSTRQGTTRFEEELILRLDGRVTEITRVEGTHRFAEYWRSQFDSMVSADSEYELTMEDTPDRVMITATVEFPSLASYNARGVTAAQVVDSFLFRSVSVSQELGPFTPDRLLSMYGPHDQATEEDWVKFLYDTVEIGYILRDEPSGTTLQWSRLAGELRSSYNMELSRKIWHAGSYWIGGTVGAFLLFVVYMGFFGRRHWDPNIE